MIPKKIALIGFMGSGKTSVGEKLAERLGYAVSDTDCMVETAAGMSISEIFSIEGEEGFRSREEAALEFASSMPVAVGSGALVLACGGGIVLSVKNRNVLAANFLSVWLDIPFKEIMRRLESQRATRPLLAGGEYERRALALYTTRQELYESCADLRYRWVEGETLERTVDRILADIALLSP